MHRYLGLTISADGTSHRKLQYECKHGHIPAPSSYSKPSPSPRRGHLFQKRFFGISNPFKHTGEAQIEGWGDFNEDIVDVTNQCPPVEGAVTQLTVHELPRKTTGYLSDHAADQKKVVRLYIEWKRQASLAHLGQTMADSAPATDLLVLYEEAQDRKIRESGGPDTWNTLSPSERERLEVESRAEVIQKLGEEAYESMSAEERHDFDLFIWFGCCMHKLLNALKGGVRGFVIHYQKHKDDSSYVLPALLANRDNQPTLDEIDPSQPLTAAQERALDVSGRGGIKLLELAGVYFNHSVDKKGEHDMYRAMKALHDGRGLNFPDVNNTRYQSYSDGAGELLTHRSFYIQYMLDTKDAKEKRNFNHMEANIYKGLNDDATYAELTCIYAYCEAVQYPYSRSVRGPGSDGINAMDLCSLHESLIAHMKRLIDDPDIVLSPHADFRTATLDGLEWMRKDAMAAVHKFTASSPRVRPLFVDFLKETLETWMRFAAPYLPGGEIATASASDRELASAPPTNDESEGELGSIRVAFNRNPSLALHMHNALVMHMRNNTQDFMNAKLSSATHQKFLRQEARRIDGCKLEKKRKADVALGQKEHVAAKRRKDDARAAKKAVFDARIHGIELVLNVEEIKRMTVAALKDQINRHKSLKEDEAVVKLKWVEIPKKPDKVLCLLGIVERYKARHEGDENALESTNIDEDSDSGNWDNEGGDENDDKDELWDD